MVSSPKTGSTGRRNWRDLVEKSMWTGGDDREAEAEDHMEQKKGVEQFTQRPKDPKTQTRRDEMRQRESERNTDRETAKLEKNSRGGENTSAGISTGARGEREMRTERRREGNQKGWEGNPNGATKQKEWRRRKGRLIGKTQKVRTKQEREQHQKGGKNTKGLINTHTKKKRKGMRTKVNNRREKPQ